MTKDEFSIRDKVVVVDDPITIIPFPEEREGYYSVWMYIARLDLVRQLMIVFDVYEGIPTPERLEQHYKINSSALQRADKYFDKIVGNPIVMDTGIRLNSLTEVEDWFNKNTEESRVPRQRSMLVNGFYMGLLTPFGNYEGNRKKL